MSNILTSFGAYFTTRPNAVTRSSWLKYWQIDQGFPWFPSEKKSQPKPCSSQESFGARHQLSCYYSFQRFDIQTRRKGRFCFVLDPFASFVCLFKQKTIGPKPTVIMTALTTSAEKNKTKSMATSPKWDANPCQIPLTRLSVWTKAMAISLDLVWFQCDFNLRSSTRAFLCILK